jgi:pimeloyl-ACP methyl ester carboxylesterase
VIVARPLVIALKLLATVSIVVLVAVLAVLFGAHEISRDKFDAKYRLPASKFALIDGTRLHYTDEGQGRPLLLMHASFMNLRAWDALTAHLAPHYRVIRVDWPPSGLSGPSPDGDYSVGRNLQLVRALVLRLALERPVVIGTSSGGILAFRYAATWPDEVARLVLINTAGMPRTAATNPNRARAGRLTTWWSSYYRSQSWWRDSLRGQFASGAEPPENFVELLSDQFRRAGLRDESALALRQFQTGDPKAEFARVRAPTLIMWGEGNITVSHLEADVITLWLTAAPSLTLKYPKLGHYPYVEAADLVARDLLAFLTGSLDEQLRVTRRDRP